MLKARNRKLSMLLVLAMLMTMFVGVGAASAADMYSVGSVPAIESGEPGQKLGSIIVTAYNFEDTGASAMNVSAAAYADAGFFVKLPADYVITKVGTNADFDAEKTFDAGDSDTYAVITPFADRGGSDAVAIVAATGQKNRVKVLAASKDNIEELRFTIPMEVKTPSSVSDEVRAMIAKEPGSVFGDGSVVVATSASGSVQAIANDTITIVASNNVAKFSVRSNTADALDKLNVKLPAGFTWDSATMTKGGTVVTATPADQDRTMKFTFTGDTKGIWSFEGTFDVDESRAKFGEVAVTLSGSGVSPSSIVLGNYSDFGVEVTTSDVPTVLAGLSELEIADITIKETAGGSLVDGRAVYLTLPDGVRWVANADDELELDNIKVTGGLKLSQDDVTVYSNKQTMARFVIDNDDTSKKGSIKLEAAQIEVAPDFAGDIKVAISGSAGISEEIVVAKAVAPVTVAADATDVKIGLQAQAGGKIVITETEAEALNATAKDANGVYEDGFLTLKAPLAVQWAKVPTVKVIEGDLEIGAVTRADNNRELRIRIKETSTVASKIEISDVAWTVDRTVPEGDMKVSVAGNAVVQVSFTNRGSVTSFVAANVVTPAPGATATSGEFRIGSNIYYVGGAAKVMDVAPYIKGDRTYVPMRYAAEMIGAEVVWDEAARTVTLTKGDDVAVFTIGSTTYTVNGEAMTADVAPEINNSRTMLPARFVAEAFGAVVGWDAGTQTVLIQK